MIRLTIPNQKYRQIGSMLTKTGQIGQNQVQMELTAVPPKQSNNEIAPGIKISSVNIRKRRFSLHWTITVNKVNYKKQIRQSRSLKSIMERHKVRAEAVAQRQNHSLSSLQTKFDQFRQNGQTGECRVMMEPTEVPSRSNQYQSITKQHWPTKANRVGHKSHSIKPK